MSLPNNPPGQVPYHETPVKEFHEAFGHPVKYQPTVPPIDTRLLRVRLIAEELIELAEAVGVNLRIDRKVLPTQGEGAQHVLEVWSAREDKCDLVEAADALGDLRYVVDGGNLVFGFPGERVLAEIHSSNMSKLGEDGKPILREDGKVLKGPHYFKPDIGKILSDALNAPTTGLG
jgi:predicted HAD superfamily Cof-like phosphohydrolase